MDKPPATVNPTVERIIRYLPFFAFGNLALAAPALVISLGVAYFTFVQAEATEKMQIATVWPRVTYDTGNLREDGSNEITMTAANQGVGPAKIQGVEISYNGKTFTNAEDLIRDCCVNDESSITLVTSSFNGEVLRPGQEVDLVRVRPDGVSAKTYEALNEQRFKVRARICYCSVFDDCWVEDTLAYEEQSVKQCPADWVQWNRP